MERLAGLGVLELESLSPNVLRCLWPASLRYSDALPILMHSAPLSPVRSFWTRRRSLLHPENFRRSLPRLTASAQ